VTLSMTTCRRSRMVKDSLMRIRGTRPEMAHESAIVECKLSVGANRKGRPSRVRAHKALRRSKAGPIVGKVVRGRWSVYTCFKGIVPFGYSITLHQPHTVRRTDTSPLPNVLINHMDDLRGLMKEIEPFIIHQPDGDRRLPVIWREPMRDRLRLEALQRSFR
jgi:hypothetical protein